MLKAFLKWQGIDYRVNAAIQEVTEDAVILATGERLPATWKMLVPRFRGARVVREPGIGDEKGFVVTDDSYRHVQFPNIFAAGLAVRVVNPFPGSVPFGSSEDRLSDRRDGQDGSGEYQPCYGGAVFACVQTVREHPRCLRHGCRQQGGVDSTNRLFPPRKFAMKPVSIEEDADLR
jgi:sulfide:quinone oxidoreductase